MKLKSSSSVALATCQCSVATCGQLHTNQVSTGVLLDSAHVDGEMVKTLFLKLVCVSAGPSHSGCQGGPDWPFLIWVIVPLQGHKPSLCPSGLTRSFHIFVFPLPFSETWFWASVFFTFSLGGGCTHCDPKTLLLSLDVPPFRINTYMMQAVR